MKILHKILLFSIITAIPSLLQGYSQLIVFGDSLSSNGNNFISNGHWNLTSPEYPTGRYTNGNQVWVEFLANTLSLPQPHPSLLGGTNFAFGGAEIGESCSSCEKKNLADQIQ